MTELLSSLTPWLFGAGGLAIVGSFGTVAVAIVKMRGGNRQKALAHDGLVAPSLLGRIDQLEKRADNLTEQNTAQAREMTRLNTRYEECEKRDAGKAKQIAAQASQITELGEVVSTLQSQITRQQEDLTGKIRTETRREVRRSLSSPHGIPAQPGPGKPEEK